MPLELAIRYADGSRGTAFIPVDDWKKPDADFNLPAWRWVARDYTATFETPKEVVEIEIDSTLELADIDRSNNVARTGFLWGIIPPSHVAFYRRWDLDRPNDRYSIRLRPTLWYAEGDGGQIGLVADGGFTFDRYLSKVGIYYNLKSRRVDHDVRYATAGDFLGRLSTLSFLVTNSDGVQRWRAEASRDIRPGSRTVSARHLVSIAAEREVMFGPNYPHPAAAWSRGGYNWIELGYRYEADASAPFGAVTAESRFSSSFASATAFTEWRISAASSLGFLGLRLDGAMAIGASLGELPAQRLFDAAGSTAREKHINEVHRLANNIDPKWSARNRLVLPGSGMLMAFASEDSAARLSANLVDARIAIGNLNPFASLLPIPVIGRVEVQAYAAGGWIPGDRMALDRLDRYAYEGGITLAIDPIALLLPRVWRDLVDPPRLVRLSATLPLYARSSLLKIQSGPYRWSIGITM
jgi:hypothetical protein